MTDSITLQGALVESRAAPRGATFANTWSDALLMAIRSLRLTLRAIDGLVVALALPVVLMGLFVYLFGGAIRTGASYIDYVVPGVLVVCIGYSAVTTSISVAHDLNEGMVDRLRSMDVGGASFMSGHVLAGAARNLISTVIVLGVAFAMGFRPHAGGPSGWELLACSPFACWLTHGSRQHSGPGQVSGSRQRHGVPGRLRRLPQQRLRPREGHGPLGTRLCRPPARHPHRGHPPRVT